MSSAVPDPVFSNLTICREIAQTALAAAKVAFAAHCRPKEDGTDGLIITHDPSSASFKHSLIAIAFAGIAIESALWLYGCAILGERECRQLEKDFLLEDRLAKLGIGDRALWKEAEAFRLARNDLVHERSLPLSRERAPIRVAQAEADRAVALMDIVLVRVGRQER